MVLFIRKHKVAAFKIFSKNDVLGFTIAQNHSTKAVRYFSNYYPIVIIGGGIIGKCMVVALDKLNVFNGKSICLIDNQSKSNLQGPIDQSYSNRVSFITPSSVSLFQKLDLWDKIKMKHSWPVCSLKLIDSDMDTYLKTQSFMSLLYSHLNFNSNEAETAGLGYIVQNKIIEDVINESLLTSSNIQWIDGANLSSLDKSDHKSFISINVETMSSSKSNTQTEKLFTSLLIGADGGNSKVRSLLGMSYYRYDYHHHGIVCTLKTSTRRQLIKEPLTAYQRFLSIGPLALLPLAENYVSLVWSVPTSFQRLLVETLAEDQFVEAVNIAMNLSLADLIFYLGNYKTSLLGSFHESNKDNSFNPPWIIGCEHGSRAAFPLKMGITPTSTLDNVVLIGDAAHSVHPLAGQGLNMGLADIHCLMTLISKYNSIGSSPGDFLMLQEYSKNRDPKNILMVQALDFIFKTYTTTGMVWQPGEKATLREIEKALKEQRQTPSLLDISRRVTNIGINSSSYIKKILMKIAMG